MIFRSYVDKVSNARRSSVGVTHSAQRAVARKARGSKGRLKARRHKQAIERRIANRRRNTMDKLSLVSHALAERIGGRAGEEQRTLATVLDDTIRKIELAPLKPKGDRACDASQR